MRNEMLKRLMDVAAVTASLPILAPVAVGVAVAIRVKLGSPVLFVHERPGLGGNLFRLYKFRTMTDERGADGELLPDTERLTGFGHLLRRMSLDELPTLLNVYRGDMSLVGPRPLLVRYLDRYSREQARRHEVKPGITGLAQINGRNNLSWDEKFAFDVWYVDNWSLLLDVRILFQTVLKVLRREGVAHPGDSTVTEFMGTENS